MPRASASSSTRPCARNAPPCSRQEPFERTEARTGYANGFKPKTLTTRLGPITFAVPQVRGDLDFYPSALEKGVRSEQALNLALAEPSGAR